MESYSREPNSSSLNVSETGGQTSPRPEDQDRSIWPGRYCDLKPLGSGAFGSAVEAKDSKNNRIVYIKKKYTNFSVLDRKNKPVLALRAYRELLFLWHFRGHKNIIHLFDAFPLQTDASMTMLCTVTDKMDMDLKRAISSEQPLISAMDRPFIVYSILCAIKYLHSARVLHRDLKPEHIGISFNDKNEVAHVRLLDFGLARKLKVEMSYVVQAMWYRAPEVWLQPGRYTEMIDLWSIGCILAELIAGKPFLPGGTGFGAQLQIIAEQLGELTENFIESADPSYHTMLAKFKGMKPKPLTQTLPQATKEEQEIIGKTIMWDPEDRWKAEQCLEHPYFFDSKDKHGLGSIYRGSRIELSFEDKDNMPFDYWIGWIDQEILAIRRNLYDTRNCEMYTIN